MLVFSAPLNHFPNLQRYWIPDSPRFHPVSQLCDDRRVGPVSCWSSFLIPPRHPREGSWIPPNQPALSTARGLKRHTIKPCKSSASWAASCSFRRTALWSRRKLCVNLPGLSREPVPHAAAGQSAASFGHIGQARGWKAAQAKRCPVPAKAHAGQCEIVYLASVGGLYLRNS